MRDRSFPSAPHRSKLQHMIAVHRMARLQLRGDGRAPVFARVSWPAASAAPAMLVLFGGPALSDHLSSRVGVVLLAATCPPGRDSYDPAALIDDWNLAGRVAGTLDRRGGADWMKRFRSTRRGRCQIADNRRGAAVDSWRRRLHRVGAHADRQLLKRPGAARPRLTGIDRPFESQPRGHVCAHRGRTPPRSSSNRARPSRRESRSSEYPLRRMAHLGHPGGPTNGRRNAMTVIRWSPATQPVLREQALRSARSRRRRARRSPPPAPRPDQGP